ncbi:MAG: glycosyltransferase [Gemmatimonadetes bacterium]|nr:glycosyltransferase [Gemmatimonadota bacterium]
MKILFVTHAFPRHAGDAAGSFLLGLAVALRERGADVSVLAPAGPGLAPSDTIAGVAVRRFRYAPAPLETLAYTGTMVEQVRESVGGALALAGMLALGRAAVRRTREQLAPDVVHAHWWFPAGLVARSQPGTTALVTTLHGTDVRLAAARGIGRRLFRYVARGSDRVTAVSSWLAERAAATCPGLAPDIAPMPVDTTLLAPPAATAARAGVLFVGRLNAQKGAADLVRAFARVHAPSKLDLVGDGPDAAATRALALELGVGDRVHFHGALPHESLPGWYQRAAVVVVPSREEGLGLVAVEAHLCGAPVVAYDSGGLRDVVRHGESGLLVPPGDGAALTDAIDTMLARPDLAAGLAAVGRREVLARFSPDAVASRYLGIYEQAIDAAARRLLAPARATAAHAPHA